MMDRTLVLAKKDLREMEQFVLVNYSLKNICTFGLFSHLINFFSPIFHLFFLFFLPLGLFACFSVACPQRETLNQLAQTTKLKIVVS